MNALIIYDDVVYAKKAKAMFETAAHRADQALAWSVELWRLDILKDPSLADFVLRDAADAHLVLLGLRNPQVVPVWLQSWLEWWVAHRQVQDPALAVLGGLDCGLVSPMAVPELSLFADRNGLSLICGCAEPIAFSFEPGEQSVHEIKQAIIPNVYHAPSAIFFYGCGIND